MVVERKLDKPIEVGALLYSRLPGKLGQALVCDVGLRGSGRRDLQACWEGAQRWFGRAVLAFWATDRCMGRGSHLLSYTLPMPLGVCSPLEPPAGWLAPMLPLQVPVYPSNSDSIKGSNAISRERALCKGRSACRAALSPCGVDSSSAYALHSCARHLCRPPVSTTHSRPPS